MLKRLLLLFLPMPMVSMAQEFNCEVSVIAPQISNERPELWKSLENTIKEFMNTRRWTSFNYSAQERIELNILITINNHPATDRFEGTLQVIYSRPVYGTDYNSPVLDLVDNNLAFNYLENTLIEFSMDRYIGNLSSILAYYAYFILGVDGDTFSTLGGTDFYNEAQQVLNNAQSSPESGWKPSEDDKNRYWLLDNQLQSVFRPLRECLYDYHRLGMDLMSTDPVEGQKNIAAAIEKLKSVHQAKPASYNLQVFFNAKADELVEIFKPVAPPEKTKLYNTLQIIDAGNISKYQNMMRGS